jgi:hypothetical protein
MIELCPKRFWRQKNGETMGVVSIQPRHCRVAALKWLIH